MVKEKSKKRRTLLIILFIVLILIILCLSSYIFYDKVLNKEVTVCDDNINYSESLLSQKIVSLTKEEIYTKTEGVWGFCDFEGDCYILNIFKDANGVENLSLGLYQTDGGYSGVITAAENQENDKYRLTIFSDNCLDENYCYTEDETNYITINIREIDNHILYVIDGSSSYSFEYITASSLTDEDNSKIYSYFTSN